MSLPCSWTLFQLAFIQFPTGQKLNSVSTLEHLSTNVCAKTKETPFLSSATGPSWIFFILRNTDVLVIIIIILNIIIC